MKYYVIVFNKDKSKCIDLERCLRSKFKKASFRKYTVWKTCTHTLKYSHMWIYVYINKEQSLGRHTPYYY